MFLSTCFIRTNRNS